jgi:hypothetical protein
MSDEIYTKIPESTNPDSGAGLVPQSTAGSNVAREIRLAAVHLAEAKRQVILAQRQVRCRNTWLDLEAVATGSDRLVALLEPTTAESRPTPKPETPDIGDDSLPF